MIQFITRQEFKQLSTYGYIPEYKYPTKFDTINDKPKNFLHSFLKSCQTKLGLSMDEFNRLVMVEYSSQKPKNILTEYEFILTKYGFAVTPLRKHKDAMLSESLVISK